MHLFVTVLGNPQMSVGACKAPGVSYGLLIIIAYRCVLKRALTYCRKGQIHQQARQRLAVQDIGVKDGGEIAHVMGTERDSEA